MIRWKALMFSKRAAVVLVLVAIAIAGVTWQLTRPKDITGLYITAEVERGTVEENVTALGTLQPLQYVDVGTQVTGQLRKLHVDIGARVEKGALLAEIDPTLLQARVDGTRATIRNLASQAAERRAQHELTIAQHERNRTLFEADATSADSYQQSAAAEKTAAAQVTGLKAQIDQAQSTLQADEANLRYTRIFAPMAGTVVSLTAREGQTLVASQQAPVILRVADLSTMTVQTQVSEADVPKIFVDMPVYFTTLGQPDRRWEGKVRQLLPTPEVVNNVVLYNVLFDVDNTDGALKPQMSAQVYFVLARAADDVLVVPAAALQPVSAARARGKSGKGDPGKGDPGKGDPGKGDRDTKRAASAAGKAGADAPTDAAAKADAGAPNEAAQSGAPVTAKADRRSGGVRAKGAAGKGRKRVFIARVLNDGRIEEREVTVGVMNRIQAEVLSGLNEGDVIVIGSNEAKKKGATPPKMGKL